MNFSAFSLWHEMGMVARAVVIILFAMSTYSLAISAERLVAFRRGKASSIRYSRALAPILAPLGQPAAAHGLEARFTASPVARVVGKGVGEFVKGLELRAAGTADYDVVEAAARAMVRTKDREVANLKRGLPALATVSSSAPFVGLFGTVGGIITAFQSLSDPTRSGGMGTVSAGIAEALVTTAVGLGVAIVAVWFYNYFTALVDALVVDIDETASEMLDGMIKGAGTANGVGRGQ